MACAFFQPKFRIKVKEKYPCSLHDKTVALYDHTLKHFQRFLLIGDFDSLKTLCGIATPCPWVQKLFWHFLIAISRKSPLPSFIVTLDLFRTSTPLPIKFLLRVLGIHPRNAEHIRAAISSLYKMYETMHSYKAVYSHCFGKYKGNLAALEEASTNSQSQHSGVSLFHSLFLNLGGCGSSSPQRNKRCIGHNYPNNAPCQLCTTVTRARGWVTGLLRAIIWLA
jgi:hypothetical protein